MFLLCFPIGKGLRVEVSGRVPKSVILAVRLQDWGCGLGAGIPERFLPPYPPPGKNYSPRSEEIWRSIGKQIPETG